MERDEFVKFRKELRKTQVEMAHLMGVSVKAVRSYEQGWRRIPIYVERQILYLMASKQNIAQTHRPCWEILNCPEERKVQCPAWEFNSGIYCWFINGTVCEGEAHCSWAEKIDICRHCKAFPKKLQLTESNSAP